MTGLSVTILVAVFLIVIAGLFAVIVERTNERDEARTLAERAVTQAETFADEAKATHAANEILCAELAESDAKIRRLSADLLAAQMRLSDGVVVPLPTAREASAYDWPPMNADDAIWSRLYDENGEHRG